MDTITLKDISLSNVILNYAQLNGWELDKNGDLPTHQKIKALEFITSNQQLNRGWLRELKMAEEDKDKAFWSEIEEIKQREDEFGLRPWDDIEIRKALSLSGQAADAVDLQETADATFRRWMNRIKKWEGNQQIEKTIRAKGFSEIRTEDQHGISISVARFIAKIQQEWGSNRGQFTPDKKTKLLSRRKKLQQYLKNYELGIMQHVNKRREPLLLVRKI